nr:AraC family transcriptional regulator [Luteolibacter marinus]
MIPCREIVIRASTGGRSLDPDIERAKRHLDRHALEGVTVQELAHVARCSSKTLRSRFAEVYGIEIPRFVREQRLAVARKLLSETDLEISVIGKRCGFSSAPNFFNFFTRHTGGIGPSEYRAAHRVPGNGAK